jgi:hypothetical protein
LSGSLDNFAKKKPTSVERVVFPQHSLEAKRRAVMKTDRVLTMQECLDEWYVVPTRVNRPAITRMVDLASHVPAARADWSKLHKLLFADAISVSKNSGFADFPASVAEIAGLDDVKQNQLAPNSSARRVAYFKAFFELSAHQASVISPVCVRDSMISWVIWFSLRRHGCAVVAKLCAFFVQRRVYAYRFRESSIFAILVSKDQGNNQT